MSDLLSPDGGRLVCLEWPLGKDPAAGGPPWAVTEHVYVAHLRNPGVTVPYDATGQVVRPPRAQATEASTTSGTIGFGGGVPLERLERFRPSRTHKAGCDSEGNVTDYISVWAHPW